MPVIAPRRRLRGRDSGRSSVTSKGYPPAVAGNEQFGRYVGAGTASIAITGRPADTPAEDPVGAGGVVGTGRSRSSPTTGA